MKTQKLQRINLFNSLDNFFNTILYKRLIEKLEQNEMVSNSKCELRKNYRTTDHIFAFAYNAKSFAIASLFFSLSPSPQCFGRTSESF